MDYKVFKKTLEEMIDTDYAAFIKALLSIEEHIDEEEILNKLYQAYMTNDILTLLNDEFYVMTYELYEGREEDD